MENAVISNYSNHITTRQKLFGNYYYEFCRFDLLQTFVLDNYQRVFFDGLSPFDKNQTVKKTKFNLLIYHIDTPIGWSFGKQLNDIEFYMLFGRSWTDFPKYKYPVSVTRDEEYLSIAIWGVDN